MTASLIGHNNPPEPVSEAAPDLAAQIAALTAHYADLHAEASNWADGSPIETRAQADEVDRLIAMVKAANKGAEAVQDAHIAPLSAQITQIREAFYPLIGDTRKVTGTGVRILKALLACKTAWGAKVAAQQRAEAERLRQEAATKAQEAATAARAALGNLEASEDAEALIRDAKASLAQANAAAKATPGAGYRTVWTATMADQVQAVRTMWKRHPDEFVALAQRLADQAVRQGARSLDGFEITEGKVAV